MGGSLAEEIEVVDVEAKQTAIVRRQAPLAMLSTVLMPSFDALWEHLRHVGAKTRHNVIVYRPIGPAEFDLEIGVEVLEPIEPSGDIIMSETPAGQAAHVRHTGPYDGLIEAHSAVQDWIDASPRRYAGVNWEVYGDWSEDPAQLQTDVYYLLER